MNPPRDHERELERLRLLESYSILDTLPEIEYDNLTTLAAEICNMPISLVSLLDDKRQWFKSHLGIDATETPKEYAFCGHAINATDKVFMIEDAREDERFHDNPLVTNEPHVIFYAGVPLKNSEGLPLGTLCVIDNKPNRLSKGQINALSILSDQVMNLLESRKYKMELERANKELKANNGELERFAYVAAHDLKSPLNNISALAGYLEKDYGATMDANGRTLIKLIKNSSDTLKNLITGLLDYSKSGELSKDDYSQINLKVLREDIAGLFSAQFDCAIHLKSDLEYIVANKTAIEQILINLLANALKYSDKEHTEIELEIKKVKIGYQISVKDNGPGILKKNQVKIFQIFETLSNKDRLGRPGNGIGLATVKKVVGNLGGEIFVESEIGEGSKFVFTIAD
ncbi:GAF domain-containing sensor histidine kinase [uncultured Kriegella sp.]|uniref:sensor histidine kinase n=1 Tax=uncultured Kriegella sp. TaxID=1798910 RepID=UPI0030D989E2|tara:strand:+ start:24002 stop:25204 length:1203 start_codon:yes stop_codon:yes gene_type:complete